MFLLGSFGSGIIGLIIEPDGSAVLYGKLLIAWTTIPITKPKASPNKTRKNKTHLCF